MPATTALRPRAAERVVARAAGHGAHAGPRICPWCRAAIADDADTDTLGGAELHRRCADEFGLWTYEGAAPTPCALDDC